MMAGSLGLCHLRVYCAGAMRIIAIIGIALFVSTSAVSAAEAPAKELFGGKARPADLKARAIGFYSRGCLSGGAAISVNGPHWQVMRLSRNRNWGHPDLIAYLEWLATQSATKDGWPGLLIGDLSQPRGGPMLTGHASHQVGLDADVWLTPMPKRRLSLKQRETMSAVAVVKTGPHEVFPDIWTDAHFRLIKRAASDARIERILVAPGIKKKLCQTETGNKNWLHKVRPYWGHNYHMHIRMRCPKGSPGCKKQNPPPKNHGCGAQLAWWYSDEPYAKPGVPVKPAKPKPSMAMAALPKSCRTVLKAADRPNTAAAVDAFLGRPTSASANPIAAALASVNMSPKLPVPLVPNPRPRR